MRPFYHLALASVALMISACGPATQAPTATLEPTTPPTATGDPNLVRLPAPTGPYQVGRTTLNFIDSSRDENHTPDIINDQREVVADVWYPAQPAPGARSGPYLPPRLGLAYGLPVSVNVSLPHAYQDAPLDTAGSPYPLILINPGFSALHTDYTYLTEELASQGFVVASVSHPYVSAATVLADGRESRFIGNLALGNVWIPRDPLDAELTEMWVPDTLFLLDKLAEGQGQLAGHIDVERIGFAGHSFGGTTSIEICASDPRCGAAASLDGLASDAAFDSGLPVPYMFIAAGNESTASDLTARTLLTGSNAGSYLLEIAGVSHFDFGDGYFIAEHLNAEDTFSFGEVGSERLYAIVRAYTVAFFTQVLRDETSPLLDESAGDFAEGTLEVNLP